MAELKYLQLGGLLELVCDTYYEDDAIDGLKDELEAMHGVRLSKSTTQDHYYITCVNSGSPNYCKYCIRFIVQFRINRPTRKILKLDKILVNHHEDCRNPEQANFIRNKHILNMNGPTITRLMRKRCQEGRGFKSPSQVFDAFCDQQKYDKNFMYQGVENGQFRRRLKKKFDNIIAESRRKLKQLGFSSQQKSKVQQEQMLLKKQTSKQEVQQKEELIHIVSTSQKSKRQEEHPTNFSQKIKPLKKKISKTK